MRPELLNFLFCDITSLKGVGKKTSQWLGLLCGHRVLDLIWHFPVSIRQRSVFKTEFPPIGQQVTFPFIPQKYIIPSIKKIPFCVQGTTPFAKVELVFFHYYRKEIETRFPLDKQLWVSGILQNKKDVLTMVHPDFVRERKEDIPTHEIVYPLNSGIQNTLLSKLIQEVLSNFPKLPEWQSEKFLKSNQCLNFNQALFNLHHPENDSDLLPLSSAYRRLAYDELLANQLSLMIVRQKSRSLSGISCPPQNSFKLNLPFELTNSQKKVIHEIVDDLASPFQMNRLLQGDVGSGKTIVAILSALQVIENNYQVALMAPTDILAQQHFQKICKLLEPLHIKVALLTAHQKGKKREEILKALSMGEISFIIGTHALIEEGVVFKNLAFVIIDEQHRFGVNQRLKLAQKQPRINTLVMSATPIPRSLALTFYGDMDVSILDEKPQGRTPITTKVLNTKKIPDIIQKLASWPNQVYWVCPLVEESENSDLMAVKKRFCELRQVFKDSVGLIHGKMKADEKESIMVDFVSGKIKILVSTTVIEVGVDVPNASLMIIEHAERFGLATLHQLRGRVGRGTLNSLCLLLYDKLSSNAEQRLNLLRETEDGFKIAEADLKMRGAGEILGWRQSGFQNFKVARLPEHTDLLMQATQEAKEILKFDPTLSTKRGQTLKILLYLFEKDTVIHTLKAG